MYQRIKSWLTKHKSVQPTSAADTQPAEAVAHQDQHKNSNHLVAYDENLLERSRTQWQFGDWVSLAAISRDTLQHHPDRAKLALLVAAGHQALGNATETRQHARLAIEWGCSTKLVSRILIAGVYNTLGRAAAISGQGPRALKHFHTSIATGTPGSDINLLAQARAGAQLTQLDLPKPHYPNNPSAFASTETSAFITNNETIFKI